jgi:hypothetical protein
MMYGCRDMVKVAHCFKLPGYSFSQTPGHSITMLTSSNLIVDAPALQDQNLLFAYFAATVAAEISSAKKVGGGFSV